jgi:hypothetical protein
MADRDSTKEDAPVVEKIETATGNPPSPPSIASGMSIAAEHLQTNEHAHLTLKESVKKWRRVVVYSFCLASAILMYGYDYVIVGTVSAMPSFQ